MDEEIIELALHRRRYLTYLSRTAATPRELVDELGDSRATVHRATDELSRHDLVERPDNDEWRITQRGKLLLKTVDNTRELVDGIEGGSALIEELPANVDIPPAVFAEGRIGVPEPPSPTYPLEQSIEKFRQAERIRGMAYGDTVPELADSVYRRGAVEGELEAEYVLSARLYEWFEEDRPAKLSEAVASSNVDLAVHDTLPFGMTMWETDGEWEMQLIAYADDGTYRGNILSAHPVAVKWAHETITRFRNEARAVAESAMREA